MQTATITTTINYPSHLGYPYIALHSLRHRLLESCGWNVETVVEVKNIKSMMPLSSTMMPNTSSLYLFVQSWVRWAATNSHESSSDHRRTRPHRPLYLLSEGETGKVKHQMNDPPLLSAPLATQILNSVWRYKVAKVMVESDGSQTCIVSLYRFRCSVDMYCVNSTRPEVMGQRHWPCISARRRYHGRWRFR